MTIISNFSKYTGTEFFDEFKVPEIKPFNSYLSLLALEDGLIYICTDNFQVRTVLNDSKVDLNMRAKTPRLIASSDIKLPYSVDFSSDFSLYVDVSSTSGVPETVLSIGGLSIEVSKSTAIFRTSSGFLPLNYVNRCHLIISRRGSKISIRLNNNPIRAIYDSEDYSGDVNFPKCDFSFFDSLILISGSELIYSLTELSASVIPRST